MQADREIHTAREDICFAEHDAQQEQAYQRGYRDRGIFKLVDAVRERILVMADGRLVEQGTFEALDKPGTVLRKLIEAE